METVRVTPGMFPPIISTTPNSPIAWAKESTIPATIPEMDKGKIMLKKVRNFDAPKVAEAAINLASTVANDAAKGWTAKGRL